MRFAAAEPVGWPSGVHRVAAAPCPEPAMVRWLQNCCSALFIMLVASSIAGAQITNGNFENGSTGWNFNPNGGGSITFPSSGGNPGGYARIESPATNSTGSYTIDQEFNCGNPGGITTCHVSVDYRLDLIAGTSGASRLKIIVDRVTKYTAPVADHIPWTTASFEVPCGHHNITLDLEITGGNSDWVACFDNVGATCDIPTPGRLSTWGRMKSLYR